jgi:hypothetical protein
MPQLIKPGSVKVVTRDGEVQVSITLELNINLNADGVRVGAQAVETKDKPEKSEWAIPDFEASPKLNFGKRE